MSHVTRNPLNLLALSSLQRKIVVHLAREGPADAHTLARALHQEQAEIQRCLEELAARGSVQISATGIATARLGRTRRRTLPARLWPALLASSRLYTAQEIATLNTAVPILQFARAKMSEFADHGPGHGLRVKSFVTQLGYVAGLSQTEQHLLRAASLFHDVGNVLDRERHHIISQETVERLTATGDLPFSQREAELVGLLCRWHRKEYNPERIDQMQDEQVRTGLLASILRVSDAMDIDHRRSDYGERFSRVLEFFYPGEMPYWTSLEEIAGVRIRCNPKVAIQVFAAHSLQDNMQFNMLRRDLEGTPLPWTIVQAPLLSEGEKELNPLQEKRRYARQKALLVYPFDAHSLTMAAISRRNLRREGWQVEMMCYPDTSSGPGWLWREALSGVAPGDYDLLVVIGDRPNPAVTGDLLQRVGVWRSAAVPVTILNRHEANWSRLPDLLDLGAELILGGDWAYFWGSKVQQRDLLWGQIAALCTRDPTQAKTRISLEQEKVAQGLLKAIYDQTGGDVDEVDGWVRLSEKLIQRIEVDDRAFFAAQADDFVRQYATPVRSPRVEGRVLCFDGAPGELPQAYYWALEGAIEKNGRMPERDIQFRMPYALATWADGDDVELLAISHWREEVATPIRFLYPSQLPPHDHLSPQPEGNECTIRVRMPLEQADAAIRGLIDACNDQ